MSPLQITHLRKLVYRFVGLSVLVSILAGQAAIACDTPVYRYAMYRWEPAPYEIYYFHNDPIPEKEAKLQKQIETVSRSEEKPANVIFIPVPLKEDTELRRVPPDVKKGWQELENPQIPSYMVVTPHGARLHLGDLDEATLKSMLDSPARGQIAKQLEEGKASVLVLLTGKEKEATAEAEKAAKTLIKDIASGKVELYMAPPMYGAPGEEPEDAPKVEVGYYKVQRDDPKEKWLVESLLSIESDLKDEEFVDKPMVFGVFGRGRALPPFVGKGINPDNLLDCVDFVTGACSCTVKDQNPGMDLLFTKDWWGAAENMAKKFGAEEGAEAQYGPADFFPQLMIPDEEAAEGEEGAEDEEGTEEEADDESDDVAVADEEEMADDPAPEDPPAEEEAPEEDPAPTEPAGKTDAEAKPATEEPAEEAPAVEPSGEPAEEAPAEMEADEAEVPAKEEPAAPAEEDPAPAAEEEPVAAPAEEAPKPAEESTEPTEEPAEPAAEEPPAATETEPIAPTEEAATSEPDEAVPEEEAASEEEAAPEEEAAMEEEAATPEDEPVGTETIIAVDEEELPAEDEAVAEEEEHPVDSTTTSPDAEAAPAMEPETSAGILAVGVGIAVALLLLFALTFAVLRPK